MGVTVGEGVWYHFSGPGSRNQVLGGVQGTKCYSLFFFDAAWVIVVLLTSWLMRSTLANVEPDFEMFWTCWEVRLSWLDIQLVGFRRQVLTISWHMIKDKITFCQLCVIFGAQENQQRWAPVFMQRTKDQRATPWLMEQDHNIFKYHFWWQTETNLLL